VFFNIHIVVHTVTAIF